jgi:hypothetical protein
LAAKHGGQPIRKRRQRTPSMMTPTTNHNPVQWTPRQGQYLAFIYAYTTIHGQAPAERDMQRFFRTTPRRPAYTICSRPLSDMASSAASKGLPDRFNFSFPVSNYPSLSKSNDFFNPFKSPATKYQVASRTKALGHFCYHASQVCFHLDIRNAKDRGCFVWLRWINS